VTDWQYYQEKYPGLYEAYRSGQEYGQISCPECYDQGLQAYYLKPEEIPTWYVRRHFHATPEEFYSSFVYEEKGMKEEEKATVETSWEKKFGEVVPLNKPDEPQNQPNGNGDIVTNGGGMGIGLVAVIAAMAMGI